MKEISVAKLAEHLGIEYRGDGDRVINGVAEIARCRSNQCAYADGAWLKKISAEAGAVLVPEVPNVEGPAWLLCEKPQRMFIDVVRLFHPEPQRPAGIQDGAHVSPGVQLDASVHVATGATVDGEVTIGPRSAILSGAVVTGAITIGADCVVHPNVTIQGRCSIGNRTIIHSGTVIGADGYGYLQDSGRHIKIPQVGGVTIGEDVEIGANVCVDRGALGDTVIGNGVKIDNLVQIAHNVTVGDHALIVAMVGISGSSSVGSGAVLAGKVGVKDHVSIGSQAIVLANATVTSDIEGGAVYAGYPAYDADTWRRSVVIQRSLPKHWKTLKKMMRQFEDSEK